MLNDSKYSKWYFSIIRNAKLRTKNFGYTEKHHVIPKFMGGTNCKENLVALTAKEHFICHLLLTKAVQFTHRRSAVFAFHCMRYTKGDRHKRYVGAHNYSKLKEERSMYLRGRKISDETKKKISESNKKPKSIEHRKSISNSKVGKESAFKGKTHSEESLQLMRQAKIGKIKSQETIEKHRAKMKGRHVTPHGPELNKKISESRRQGSRYAGVYLITLKDGSKIATESIWDFIIEYNFPKNTIRKLVDLNGETVKQGKCKGITIVRVN